VAHLQFFQTHKAEQKTAKEPSGNALADQKTAHLILPNRTLTLRTLWTKTRKGKVHFADFIILGQLK
jgi:hypothetical protein